MKHKFQHQIWTHFVWPSYYPLIEWFKELLLFLCVWNVLKARDFKKPYFSFSWTIRMWGTTRLTFLQGSELELHICCHLRSREAPQFASVFTIPCCFFESQLQFFTVIMLLLFIYLDWIYLFMLHVRVLRTFKFDTCTKLSLTQGFPVRSVG